MHVIVLMFFSESTCMKRVSLETISIAMTCVHFSMITTSIISVVRKSCSTGCKPPGLFANDLLGLEFCFRGRLYDEGLLESCKTRLPFYKLLFASCGGMETCRDVGSQGLHLHEREGYAHLPEDEDGLR